eukprot:753000-Hanusia_phi.AAC.6
MAKQQLQSVTLDEKTGTTTYQNQHCRPRILDPANIALFETRHVNISASEGSLRTKSFITTRSKEQHKQEKPGDQRSGHNSYSVEVLVGETVLPVLKQTRQPCPRRLHPAPPMVITPPLLSTVDAFAPYPYPFVLWVCEGIIRTVPAGRTPGATEPRPHCRYSWQAPALVRRYGAGRGPARGWIPTHRGTAAVLRVTRPLA